jgi:hypothetical protein
MYTKQNIFFSHSSVFSSNISSILYVCTTSEREEKKEIHSFILFVLVLSNVNV